MDYSILRPHIKALRNAPIQWITESKLSYRFATHSVARISVQETIPHTQDLSRRMGTDP